MIGKRRAGMVACTCKQLLVCHCVSVCVCVPACHHYNKDVCMHEGLEALANKGCQLWEMMLEEARKLTSS